MYSRKEIFNNNSYAHVTFRCLNREFLFTPPEVKQFIILTWLKYFKRYQIKVFAFIVMDNHAHLVLHAPCADNLGNAMRTVNSQIAKFVNKFHGRDSHALKERYKSPVITNDIYMRRTLQYLWLNRYKVDGSDPKLDPYCSISWKMHPEIMQLVFKHFKELDLLPTLLTSLTNLPLPFQETYRELQNLLNEAKNNILALSKNIFQNIHTIGDEAAIKFRGQILSSGRRGHFPWIPI